MARAKFLQPTSHPDYGPIEEGEVLEVTREYLDHYVAASLAEETTEEPSRPALTTE